MPTKRKSDADVDADRSTAAAVSVVGGLGGRKRLRDSPELNIDGVDPMASSAVSDILEMAFAKSHDIALSVATQEETIQTPAPRLPISKPHSDRFLMAPATQAVWEKYLRWMSTVFSMPDDYKLVVPENLNDITPKASTGAIDGGVVLHTYDVPDVSTAKRYRLLLVEYEKEPVSPLPPMQELPAGLAQFVEFGAMVESSVRLYRNINPFLRRIFSDEDFEYVWKDFLRTKVKSNTPKDDFKHLMHALYLEYRNLPNETLVLFRKEDAMVVANGVYQMACNATMKRDISHCALVIAFLLRYHCGISFRTDYIGSLVGRKDSAFYEWAQRDVARMKVRPVVSNNTKMTINSLHPNSSSLSSVSVLGAETNAHVASSDTEESDINDE